MKLLSFLVLIFISIQLQAQTYIKVADKDEFVKFMNYCQTPVSRTVRMTGDVSLVKYNSDYSNPILYYTQPITGDWMAKYPFVIKWYPVDAKSTTQEAYQTEITISFELKVPRVYCTSMSEYKDLFNKHWKNGDIQSGWWDSHFIGITP